MNAPHPAEEHDDNEMPVVEHLIELRTRLIRIILAIAVVFVLLLPFNGHIYTLFARPVLANLLPEQTMLVKDAIDVLLTPIKVCFIIAVMITIPWILYQIWAFVAPGMYRHEKRLMLPILVSSTALFYAGVLFAYFVILPIMFNFLIGIELPGVTFMPDITNYMSVSIAMFFAFGVVFEAPVATVILVMLGVVSSKTLAAKRPYIILGAFVVGMLLTPPDIFSQTLLALPLLVLFELGLIIARRLEKQRDMAENAENS
ncbi:MAG: twin-arginine translocase subunit TatC [Cardiobacteriaceae bacterium]|nr:twin-arginine translocase subunit TatC [Cardiobacteriaceae bacterium]